MRKTILCLWAMTAVMLFVACDRGSSYSRQLEQEQELIQKFIEREGITVIHEFPADSVFPPKTFYHAAEDSIWFRLDTKGTGDTVRKGDRLQVRYIESTLSEMPHVESYWTTMDLDYPVEILYNSGISSNTCPGWNDAFRMMQRHGAVAEIIVPSTLGFSWATTSKALTPYYYKLKIKILPR